MTVPELTRLMSLGILLTDLLLILELPTVSIMNEVVSIFRHFFFLDIRNGDQIPYSPIGDSGDTNFERLERKDLAI